MSTSSSRATTAADGPGSGNWQANLREQMTTYFSDPANAQLLLKVLADTGKADGDPCSSAAYFRDKEQAKEDRSSRRLVLATFLAPSLRTGSKAFSGAASSFSNDDFWLDFEAAEADWKAIGQAGTFRSTWRQYGNRVDARKRADQDKFTAHVLGRGEKPHNFKPDYDFVWRKMSFVAVYRFTVAHFFRAADVADGNRKLEHDQKALLSEPIFRAKVGEWAKQVHRVLDFCIDPHSLTMLCQYGGSRMQEDMQTISQQLKFFRNKASGHTLVNAFNKIDKQDVSTVSLSTALLDMFRQSYERPKTVPRLSDENKKLILRSVRKRFLRDNVDQNLLQVIKIERRARDVAAAAARVQELVVGLARDGGFGLADRIEQDTTKDLMQPYLDMTETVCSGTIDVAQELVDFLQLSADEIAADNEQAGEYLDKFEDARSSRAASKGKGKNKGKGKVGEVVPGVVDDLDDLDDDAYEPGRERSSKAGEGESVDEDLQKLGETSTTVVGGKDGIGSNKLTDVGPFHLYNGKTLQHGSPARELDAAETELEAYLKGDTWLDNRFASSEAVDAKTAIEAVVAQLRKGISSILEGDQYAAIITARALLGTYAPPVEGRRFGLSQGVARFTRARARIDKHKVVLDGMADALSQVIWIGVFLALALPEAGLAGLWVDATVIQIGRDMNASQEQERVIHSVAMDAQGAILNLEKFASQGMASIEREATKRKTGGVDARWYLASIQIQGGMCYDHSTCDRPLVYQIGQRREENQDGERLSVSCLQRRKPLPLDDHLPQESYYECLFWLFGCAFCPGMMLSVARVSTLVHATDKASRGKPAGIYGGGGDDGDDDQPFGN